MESHQTSQETCIQPGREIKFCLRAREVGVQGKEGGCKNELQSHKVPCPTPEPQTLEIKATPIAIFSKQKAGVEFLPMSRKPIYCKTGYRKGH